MEHRWGKRKRIDWAVHVWTAAGVASKGQLRDVSISGGFIVTALPVRLLGRVSLQFKSATGPGRVKFTAEAQVVRVEGEGFAVEWCEFAPSGIRTLIRAARADALDQRTRGIEHAVQPACDGTEGAAARRTNARHHSSSRK